MSYLDELKNELKKRNIKYGAGNAQTVPSSNSIKSDLLQELKKRNLYVTDGLTDEDKYPIFTTTQEENTGDGDSALKKLWNKTGGTLQLLKAPENWKDIGDRRYKNNAENALAVVGEGIKDTVATVRGTAGDLATRILQGGLSFFEGLSDTLGYGLAYGADFLGADEVANNLREGSKFDWTGAVTNRLADTFDKTSVLGSTTQSVAQGVGQVGAMAILGGAGAPNAATLGAVGVSAMGSGMGEAYKSGATDNEALAYGIISGAGESFSEMLFGGVGAGLTGLGFNTGLLGVDDLIAKKASGLFKKTWAKNLVNTLVKATGEGVEEVVSGLIQALGKKLTYMDEESYSKILSDENLFEQFAVGALTSGLTQAPTAIKANKAGVDMITGQTKAEDAFIKAETQNRINEKWSDSGKRLTAKEKSTIQTEVENDLESGRITPDMIEKTLGGEAYEQYQQLVSESDEFNNLYDTPYEKLSEKQRDRLAELKEKNNAITYDDAIYNAYEELKNKVTDSGKSFKESYADRGRRVQKFQADISQYDEKYRSTVQKAIDSGILNNTNRSHEFVDFVAKVSSDTDVQFDFSNNKKLAESGLALEGLTVNGVTTGDGVTINMDSAKALNTVVGHEITHILEGTELYNALQTTIFDLAKSKGEFDSRRAALEKLYKDVEGADIDAELTADLVGDYLFTDKAFIQSLSTKHRNVFQKIYDQIKHLCKLATAGSKEARQLEKVKKIFEEVYREAGQSEKSTAQDGGVKYSISEIVDGNGNSYGVGVHLDSTLLDNLTPKERVEMVKEYIKELGGESFTAYDANGDAVDISIAEPDKRFKNKNGKTTPVNRDLTTKYIGNEVKQESITLIDELIATAEYKNQLAPNYSHGWLDGNGQNNWEYWKTYVQDKTGDIWQATLNVANASSGEKILYDVNPIKKVGQSVKSDTSLPFVGQSVKSDTSSTTNSISNSGENVNTKFSLSPEGEQATRYGDYNVYGEDIKNLGWDDIAPPVEAAQNAETTVGDDIAPPVENAQREATTDDIAPTREEIAKVNEQRATEREEVVSAAERNAVDEIAPPVYSYESLVAQQERIREQMEKMFENADTSDLQWQNEFTRLNNQWNALEEKIKAWEAKAGDIELVKTAVTKISRSVRQLLGLSNKQMADVRGLIEKYSDKRISSREQLYSEVKELFEEYTEKVTDESLKQVQKDLRTYGIKVSDAVKSQITDFNDLRKRNFGKIRLSKNGVAVDVAYQELQEIAPGYFPDDIVNPADQLMRIIDVANMQAEIVNKLDIDAETLWEATDTIINGVNEYRHKVLERIGAYQREPLDLDAALRNRPQGEGVPFEDLAPPIDTESGQQTFTQEAATEADAEATRQTGDTARQHNPNVQKKFDRIDSIAEIDQKALETERNKKLDNLGTKPEYVSKRAGALFDEIYYYQKGNKISKQLSEFLDVSGGDWAGLKAVFSNIKYNPDHQVNVNSSLENLVRKTLNDEFKEKVYDIDDEYQRNLKALESKVEQDKKNVDIAEQRRIKANEYTAEIAELVGDTSTWVDKKLGLQYQTSTLHRNLRDVVRDAVGNRDIRKADAIYEYLQGTYNTNEASLKRESAKIKKKYADLKITKAESTYIQMLGEFKYNPDTELQADVVQDYYKKNQSQINTEKVDKVIEMARQDYDALLDRVNAVLKEHGMREIPYRQGYFPHFTETKQGWFAKMMNWKVRDDSIPTNIAGLTEDFKPYRSWQSFNKQRTTDVTNYDFLKGIDSYTHGALDWIYHIGDIQRRRSFENYIRYTHSDMGVQNRINEILANDSLDADEVQSAIDQVWAEKNNPLNNFVSDLRTGTNTLAGKKSSMDRGVEAATNRKVYSTMTNLSNRVSANMVAGSVSSALTNFIPITQSWGEVSPKYTLLAMKDTLKNGIVDDGVVDRSDFLTNRLNNEENLSKTAWDKVGEKVGWLMETVDGFTSQVVWRSKYLQNIADGMTENAAVQDANNYAEGLMAGRSRGNMPTIFESKNPFIKIATLFQLEVANQYEYMGKDMVQNAKGDTAKKKVASLAKGYLSMFVGAYAYNALFSALTGRNAAFDPIRIIRDLVKSIRGELDEDDEDRDWTSVITGLGEDVLEETPYIGGLLGGGRIPIASAIPYGGVTDMVSGTLSDLEDRDWENLTAEWLNLVYYGVMPMGGGQLRKTMQGLSMFDDDLPISGSYTTSGNLRFPVEDTVGNRLQAAVFGQWASQNAQDYLEQGKRPLSEKQTEEFLDLGVTIQDYWDMRKDMSKIEADKDSDGNTVSGSKKKKVVQYIDGLDLTAAQKVTLYNGQYESEEDQVLERLTTNFDDDDYWAWLCGLSSIESDKDSGGNTISGSRKKKVVELLNNLEYLDYGQKIVLYRSEFQNDDTYCEEIVEYINNLAWLDYSDRVDVLKALGFTISEDGAKVYW